MAGPADRPKPDLRHEIRPGLALAVARDPIFSGKFGRGRPRWTRKTRFMSRDPPRKGASGLLKPCFQWEIRPRRAPPVARSPFYAKTSGQQRPSGRMKPCFRQEIRPTQALPIVRNPTFGRRSEQGGPRRSPETLFRWEFRNPREASLLAGGLVFLACSGPTAGLSLPCGGTDTLPLVTVAVWGGTLVICWHLPRQA